ncbi:MAG: hypothetical protein GWN73_00905 [Actinobacteria bacterium]|nr:hypothetical protein [Actinomycetota bacterium]NIS28606.1 hypothetical protein [Actinomycetota bacterium]NIT94044.1 hypothetical protein [Actinomycetota bacterium]NIU64069.1 hypothetical protein [Actinomycetota bacterium]NIV54180.1 hypothetical protein [Actinomycetota bacterium]
MEEGHEATGPLVLAQVDRLDPCRSQLSRASLRTPGEALQRGRVDQMDLRGQVPPAAENLEVVVAQPQPFGGSVAPGDLQQRFEHRLVLDVDAQG